MIYRACLRCFADRSPAADASNSAAFAALGHRRRTRRAAPPRGAYPKTGRPAIFVAWLIGVVLIYRYCRRLKPDDARRVAGSLYWAASSSPSAGLLDDWFDLKPWAQFAIQFAGAAVAVGHLIFIEVFTNPIGAAFWELPAASPGSLRLTGDLVWIWRPLAIFFTIFWVVGMINAINWLDGLDGLAAGVCTIAALLFAWHSNLLGQTTVALFPLALAGALLGFLPLILRRRASSWDRPAPIFWATRWRPCPFCRRPSCRRHCWSWPCRFWMSPGRSSTGCVAVRILCKATAATFISAF